MISGLTSYPVVKDSGVPWLGEVPEHWLLRRMKTVMRQRAEKGFPEEPLLAATQSKGVVRKEQYENRTVLALKDLHLLKLVRHGDFVISLRSFQGGIEYAREQGIISPAYTVLYPTSPGSHGFLAWLFKSKPFVDNLSLYVTGIRQGQNIDYAKLSRSEIPLPPLAEQAAIARFLDNADRRIRRYIRAKQKLIKLLEERVAARASQAMRHPRCRTLRLGRVVTEHVRSITREDAGTYIALGLYNRGRGIFHKRPILGAELGDSTFSWVEPGDLVISGQFAWEGAVALASSAEKGTIVSHRYYVLRGINEQSTAPYLWALLRSDYGAMLLDQHSRGAAGRNRPLNLRTLLKEHVPVPPYEVQVTVDTELAAIAPLRAQAAAAITLLREFHTRLIADVVTGKLDVRDAAAHLPKEAEEIEQLDEADGTNGTDGGEDQAVDESELEEVEV